MRTSRCLRLSPWLLLCSCGDFFAFSMLSHEVLSKEQSIRVDGHGGGTSHKREIGRKKETGHSKRDWSLEGDWLQKEGLVTRGRPVTGWRLFAGKGTGRSQGDWSRNLKGECT